MVKIMGLFLAVQLNQPPQARPPILQVKKNFLSSKIKRDTTQNYIVVHNDGGNLSASATRIVLRMRRLAYHYFIARDGTITQFMDLKYVAKHAGISNWNGLTGWNAFSIGVCLQGRDGLNYTEKQYASLKNLVQYINIRYPDSKTKPILGHQDIAFPSGRKSDPGEHFELWRLYNDTTNITRG
jgi:N-acetyl-anhydromuramyl-L-alanine amidase AmpD